MSFSRLTALAIAFAAGFAILAADQANARPGGSKSFGSRGTRTFTAPPATNTAPKAAPIEKSITQRGAAPTAAQQAPQASRFGGWRGILMGGLIAAALGGIFGFGALASVLGFMLQFALVAGLIYLVVSFIRSRSQPALARAPLHGAGGPARRDLGSGQALASNGSVPASSGSLKIGPSDLDSFERLLGEIQTAYGREDLDKLAAMTTPEVLAEFSQDLAANARRGVRNEISDVKLLQGDLSEAWRENGSDYATVAMRFSLVDATVDRATGSLVAGDRSRATEATEFWTFRRDDRAAADGWQLSAIQQAA
jgi:predicted lipid-binding transport protein (Tim44 family)